MKYFGLLILAAWSFVSSAQERTGEALDAGACSTKLDRGPHSAMSDQELDEIRKLSALLISGGAQKVQLDYSEESIKWLDATLTKKRESLGQKDPGRSAMLFGSYFGEALAKRYNGKWVMVGREPAVLVNDKVLLFPMGRVLNHLQQGERCSIYAYYAQLPELLGKE